MLILKSVIDLLKESIVGWSKNEATLRAAALAYYTIFSVAPLLILSVAIASQVFNQAAVEGQIVAVMEERIGIEAATAIQDIMKNGFDIYSNRLATGISLIILLFGASTLFLQLQAAINAMWEIVPTMEDVRQSLITTIQARLLSAAFVLATGFLVIISLLFTTLWAAIPTTYLEILPPDIRGFIPLLHILSSPVIYMFLFTFAFKALPQAKIRWRDVLPGATVTAVLFWLGGYIIARVLSQSVIASIYGAAGSLIFILLWVYYSAWIFLFGAKFTHVYTKKYGVPIEPYNGMTFRSDAQPKEPDASA